MKEIDVIEVINNLKLTEALAKSFAKKSGIDEDKIKLYLDEKIKQRINNIGKSFASGDMKPEEFNKLRRLSDVDLSQISDKIIKDK